MRRPNPDSRFRGACMADPMGALRTVLRALAITLGLLAIFALTTALTAPAIAQGTNGQSAVTPPGDLRCLTRRAEDCLPAPVPIDEPHGAVCATCHTLWVRGAPGGTIKSCSAAGCHERPETLTPFHRTVSATTLADCTGCHVSHSFRAPDRSAGCTTCHAAGGTPAAQAHGTPARRLPSGLAFRHDEHGGVNCVSCHTSRNAHGTVKVSRLQDCQSCHHAAPATSDCVGCHDRQELESLSFTVTRALDIRIGSLQRPVRTLVFDHARHADVTCTTCHTGPDLEAPATSDCSSCHLEHHAADADCSACHERPAAGAHDRKSHLGCGGVGCHERVPAAIELAPRTRQLCLACHTDQRDHRPERDCADCHLLPPPRGPAAKPSSTR